MARRSPITGTPPQPNEHHDQALRLLAHARHLLDQAAIRQQALEQCLATLQNAAPRAYFRYTLDPPTLTPCPYRRAGSQSPTFLTPRFKAALGKARGRSEFVRRNTVLILVRLGFPVSLWHLLFSSPLPTDPAGLAPQTSQAG